MKMLAIAVAECDDLRGREANFVFDWYEVGVAKIDELLSNFVISCDYEVGQRSFFVLITHYFSSWGEQNHQNRTTKTKLRVAGLTETSFFVFVTYIITALTYVHLEYVHKTGNKIDNAQVLI
jgi:hypothetical protein